MRRIFLLVLLLPLLVSLGSDGVAQSQIAADNLVLITLDGTRTEEVFGGLDLDVLKSTLRESDTVEATTSYQRFWAPTREERRQKLMPFFWSLVTKQGSIAGDQQSGSAALLRNGHWFSYPGYAEILLGEPHDDVIKSNDAIRNPYPTVLETLKERLKLPREKVATFASWSVHNEIVEHTAGVTFTNAGSEAMEAEGEDFSVLNTLQSEAVSPWDGSRFDAFTFRLAMRHLASARPRVLYLALGDTDDWAHDGRYDRVLNALSRNDGYLKELWTWLQSQPDYRGRTHLLITTDHGRGHTTKDWRDHGARIQRSNEVWIAFVSPKMSERGPWRDHAPVSTSQIAATMASWMGVDWNADHPQAGKPIQ